MAVLQSENKRLRDKFNQIVKESKVKENAYLSTIDNDKRMIDKMNADLEKSSIEVAKLEALIVTNKQNALEELDIQKKKLNKKYEELDEEHQRTLKNIDDFEKFQKEK